MLYKVILVEDDPLIRQGLSEIIAWEECGLEIVKCASDGRSALEFLKNEVADICITDIKMPKMDGLTLMKKCNQENYKMKYIVLSGYTDFELVKEAIQIGVENYLVKPVNKVEMIQTLMTVVEKLDSEQKNQEVMNNGIKVFRENLLYRWIAGQITYDEFLERKTHLGFAISENYIVGIIKLLPIERDVCEEKWHREEKEKHLRRLVSTINNYAEGSIGLLDLNGDLIMLFPEANKNYFKIKEFINKMIRVASDNKKFYVFGGMGEVVESPNEIEKSFYQARFILDNYAMCSENEMVWHQEIGGHISGIPANYYDKMLAIANKFNMNDKAEIFKVLDELFGCIEYPTRIRWETLQAFGVIFLGDIFQKVIRYRPHSAIELEYLQMQLVEIYQCSTLKEMINWMKDMVDKILVISSESVSKYSKSIYGLIQYMKYNYNNDMCIKNTAEIFQLNPVYLGKLFFQETGTTFTEYLNELRVNEAKKLLINTDVKIQKIAETVGYQNTNYFYAIFKKNVGVTPAEFRGRSEQKNI